MSGLDPDDRMSVSDDTRKNPSSFDSLRWEDEMLTVLNEEIVGELVTTVDYNKVQKEKP